jgi:tRNA(Ile2) C34 agmatinyltransferase TiaS
VQEFQTCRIFVPGDQLALAREVASQPIPQDVIDQSKIKVEDFVPPTCPKCGAEDPLLESVEPMNAWRCENCGAQWSDSAAFDPTSRAGN